jgi:single-strand DNA-binding protein
LGRDCEKRLTKNGDTVANFSVAVNSGYGNKAITNWVTCSSFGRQAESLMPYLLKGTKVAVSGELSLSEYMSKDGIAKSTLDVRVGSITLLSNKPAANEPSVPNVNRQIQPIDSIQDGDEIDYPF